MLNIFKKGLCVMLAGTFLSSIAVVPSFAAERGSSLKFYENSFEVEKLGDERNSLVDSGDSIRGNVLKITPSSSTKYTEKNVLIESGRNYMITFDIKADQTDHPIKFMFRDTANKDFAHITLDMFNNFVVSRTGWSPWRLDNNYDATPWAAVGKYGTGWNNITMLVSPDGEKTKIDYYINGNLAYEADTTLGENGEGEELKGETGVLKYIYFLTTDTGTSVGAPSAVTYDGNEAFYIDNLKVSYVDDYMTAEAKLVDDSIVVSLSEPPSGAIPTGNVKLIKAANGEEVQLTSVQATGVTELKIITNDGMLDETEYMVVLPNNISSISGKPLFSNRIAFVTPSGGERMPEIAVLNKAFDYESMTVGAAASNDMWRGVIETDHTSNISSVITADKNGNDTKAIKYEIKAGSTMLRLEDGATRFQDLETESTVVVSIDIKRDDITKRTPTFKVMGNSDLTNEGNVDVTIGKFFIDSYGNFVCVNKGDLGSAEDVNHGVDGAAYSSHLIVYDAPVQNGSWNTVTVVFNKTDGSIIYYFDGVKVATGNKAWGVNTGTEFAGLRAQSEVSLNNCVMYVDNFKIGYPVSSAKVTHFRIVDREGGRYGAGEAAAPVDMRSGSIYLNSLIDENTINSTKITLSEPGGSNILQDLTYNSSNNTIDFEIDELLKKNATYTMNVEGLKDTGGKNLAAYTAQFTTSDKSELVMTDYAFYKGTDIVDDISDISNGDTITLKAKFISTFDDDITRTLSAAGFTNFVMEDSDKQQFTINGIDNYSQREQTITVSLTLTDTTDSQIMGGILDENGYPTNNIIIFGQPEFVSDTWSLSFSDKTTSDTLVYCEVHAPALSTRSVVYRGYATADAEGKFDVNLRLKNTDKSGWYKLIWIDENGVDGEKQILFNNLDEAKLAVVAINNAIRDTSSDRLIDIATISNIIETNKYAFGIDNASFDLLNKTQIAEIIFENIDKNGLLSENTEDIPDSVATTNRAVEIVAIDAGYTTNLFDNALELNLSNSRIKDFYNKYYVSESMQQGITTNLKNGNYKSFESFYKALTEKFVLAAVAQPDGVDNVTELIKYFSGADEIGTGATGTEYAYRAVMGNTYANYSELKAAFDTANTPQPTRTPEPPQGGGGGGGAGGALTVNTNLVQTQPESQTIPYPVFSDIDHVLWAKDAITYLAEKKIINGKGDHQFCPDDLITRQEIAKIAVLAFEFEYENSPKSSFSDVSDWAKVYVDCVSENGVANGYNDTTFGAVDYITRQDLAVIVYRAALQAGYEFDIAISNPFADVNSISDYAVEAVNVLYNAGVINGTGNGEFAPLANASRAEAAKIIYSILKL